MEQTILSRQIKELRKEYNLTQQDLAFKSGVGLRFLRELEQGKPTVRVDKVNQVLEMFNMQVGAVPMERRNIYVPQAPLIPQGGKNQQKQKSLTPCPSLLERGRG